MSSTLQRRCAQDGCRSPAAPPDTFCPQHRPSPISIVTAQTGKRRTRGKRDEFAISVALRQELGQLTEEALDLIALELGAVRSMTREIGILRLLLAHEVSDGLEHGDTRALTKSVLPLVAEIGRALRTNEQIRDGERDLIAEAMARTLIEHGKSLRL